MAFRLRSCRAAVLPDIDTVPPVRMVNESIALSSCCRSWRFKSPTCSTCWSARTSSVRRVYSETAWAVASSRQPFKV